MMIIGRLLAGTGIGISSALVPLYISEISPTEIRGALGSVNQLFICIGILAALVAGLPLAANPLWWRTMFGIAIIPAVLMALGMAVSAESPRWLFQQGKLSQAETAIKKLWGKERVAEVLQDLRASSQGSTEPEAGWFDLFNSRYWKGAKVNGEEPLMSLEEPLPDWSRWQSCSSQEHESNFWSPVVGILRNKRGH